MFIIVYFVLRAILFLKCHKIKYLCFFTTTYHTRFLMDPPLNTGTSVSSGSCFSTLPSGLQPGMTSLEACTSWLLGVSQSPPVESCPVTGVPLPPQPCVMSSWSVNSLNSLGRPISQQPVLWVTSFPQLSLFRLSRCRQAILFMTNHSTGPLISLRLISSILSHLSCHPC